MIALPIPRLVDLVAYALAVYYLAHILIWEKGPFYILDWLRGKLGVVIVRAGALEAVDGEYVHRVIRPGLLADLVTCIYCLGFWLALVLLPALLWLPVVLYPFAAAGLAAVLYARE